MKLFNKVPFNQKIILIAVLPSLGLFYFLTTSLLNYWTLYQEFNQLKHISIFATKTSSLIHELQKERGISAGFLGSRGKKFRTIILRQRNLSNQANRNFQQFLKKFNSSKLTREGQQKLKEAQKRLQ
ncbi:MAG: methyl-accepting chemotaxis protein, partial [bacterium]